MDLRALINRDNLNRPFDASGQKQGDTGGQPGSSQFDPADLLDAFARIHALGLAHLASHGNSAGQGEAGWRINAGKHHSGPRGELCHKGYCRCSLRRRHQLFRQRLRPQVPVHPAR
jgi:hypothetical protein